jgi:LacI family repressor for deo operon, udp, cdd, tsx, nupC, and nupG
MYDVAKQAGVSTATVSRVLSQPNVVAPATRRRVLQAVERLRFEPNSTAKNLRTLKTGKLLVTVPDMANPFFSEILQAIEVPRSVTAIQCSSATPNDAKREEGYALMLRSFGKPKDSASSSGIVCPNQRRSSFDLSGRIAHRSSTDVSSVPT